MVALPVQIEKLLDKHSVPIGNNNVLTGLAQYEQVMMMMMPSKQGACLVCLLFADNLQPCTSYCSTTRCCSLASLSQCCLPSVNYGYEKHAVLPPLPLTTTHAACAPPSMRAVVHSWHTSARDQLLRPPVSPLL